MTWADLKIFLLSFLLPFSVAIVPLMVILVKVMASNKKLKGQLSIESFNSIINANSQLRDEFKKERDELKKELREEREMVDKLANTAVINASKIEQVLFQNKVLVQHLKNILGMKNIVNIKNIKISVLEDSDTDSELLHRLFRTNGIENVSFFKDYETFVENIDSNVRILIIDHKLSSGVNGLDVIKKVIDSQEYRYFIMLSGSEDFNVIYNFNRLVTHGVYILKGRPDSNDIILKSIRSTIYYLNILSDTYNEISSMKTELFKI